MSNIKGTVTTLRQFLFNVESEVKTEVNGIKYPIIYFKKAPPSILTRSSSAW